MNFSTADASLFVLVFILIVASRSFSPRVDHFRPFGRSRRH